MNPYVVQTFAKTTAGTLIADFTYLSKQLNQRLGEFEIVDLNGVTTSATDYEIIKQVDLNLFDTEGDFRVLAVIPFSCDQADCLFDAKLQIADTTYDINSLLTMRESNGANSIGVAILQYLFEDVNSTTVNLNLWAKTDIGTITIEGGSLSIIHVNATDVLLPNPPQPPLVFAPINGADVNGAVVDYNCFTTDPNNDPLTYDVNIIFRDTNTTALELESGGNGNGTFDSTDLANGVYSMDCTATRHIFYQGRGSLPIHFTKKNKERSLLFRNKNRQLQKNSYNKK